MSWMQKLYETYNNCEGMVGYSSDESKRPLLPFCHITAQAHIEVTIDGEGNFIKANLIADKKHDATTIIPATEGSASKSGSKPESHPLCDSLQYLAGDFEKYGGNITSGFAEEYTITEEKIKKVGLKWKDVIQEMKNNKWIEVIAKNKYRVITDLNVIKENLKDISENDYQSLVFCIEQSEPFMNYITGLSAWCNSDYSHPKLQAILNYVKKKALINDLIIHKILIIGEDGQLANKRTMKKEKNDPDDIFDVTNSNQEKAFVRWIVETREEIEKRVWRDKTLWDCWAKFYLSSKKKELICFVTGKEDVLTTQHPRYIRAKGDGAKIISSNDTSGFTYRGRFKTDHQACGVSLEVTQKAHHALMWLIDRQGKVFKEKNDPSLAVVAWAVSGKEIPQPTDDILSVIDFDDLKKDSLAGVETAQDVAIKFRNKMLGYATEISSTDNIIVVALDSASKGRLAITFYREDLSGSEFLKRIEKWHKSGEWIHEYRYKNIQDINTGKWRRYYQPFLGMPAPINIAEAAYGLKADDKIKKVTIARLLPCIINGSSLPRDILESVIRRASHRIALKDSEDKYEREWNKTLSIACSLYKNYSKEDYKMALDENRNTRDYLYGRLLALAESLEQWALNEAGESRPTNAARLMQRFSENPFSTWKLIEESLTPYKIRLGNKSNKRQRIIDKVICSFEPGDFMIDKKLGGEYLLGYHCQRAELWKDTSREAEEKVTNAQVEE